jgi:hypothetical protein
MEKIIILQSLTEKKNINFFCEDFYTDFSQRSTQILVYFNDMNNSHYNLHAELLISENKQSQTHEFDLHIPNGVNSATIIVSTNVRGHKLDSIHAQAV